MADALTNTNPSRVMLSAVLGAVVVLGAMGLITWQALRLEERERLAQAQAQFHESLRLALWRIDSAMTPIIAREAARPYFEYQPFYPAQPSTIRSASDAVTGAAGNPDNSLGADRAGGDGEVLVPSPLLSNVDEVVNLHFQIDNDGKVSSPQVPEGKLKELAESGYVTPYSIARSHDRLKQLQPQVSGWAATAYRSGLAAEDVKSALDKQESALRAAAADSPTLDQVSAAEKNSVAPDRDDARRSGTAQTPVSVNAPPRAASGGGKPSDAGESEYLARRDLVSKTNEQYNQQAVEQASRQQRGLVTKDAKNRVPHAEPQAAVPPATTSSDEPVEEAQRAKAKTESDARTASETQSTRDVSPTKQSGNVIVPTLPGAATDVQSDSERRPSGDLAAAGARVPELFDDSLSWPSGSSELIVQGQFAPRWLEHAGAEPDLIFVRQVRVGDKTLEQGFWIDWPRLRSTLLDPVRPLFPTCDIQPVADLTSGAARPMSRMLATIPAELIVPAPVSVHALAWTPLRSVLVVAWLLVIASLVAISAVVRASLELAERRGRFVSAVTHELRTPLTTFCLYSQMLSDGMVPDEESKRSYARTLHTESLRLTRIVESVLDFARLGRGARAVPESMTLDGLRARLEPALRSACERADMQFQATLETDGAAPVRTDPGIIERVLSNLIDNACKYAAGSDDRRVILSWTVAEGRLRVRVRDYGPGVPPEDALRVFDPFVRGRAHALGSTQGLGLGLALSRGLAERLGGSLRLVQASPGAEFLLDVPAA